MVDISDLLLGGVAGVAVGVPLGALIRPPAANLERVARRIWKYDPLIVHVERDPTIIWSGTPDWMPFSLYCRDPLSLPDPPEGRDEWLSWGRELGCVDAHMTQLRITLQAKTDVAVIVEGLRVSHHKKSVETGLILTRATGGADLDPRRFNIDLDWGDPPVVTFVGDGGEPATTPSLKLSAGDLEQFHIWATASSDWHEWSLELLLLVEGRRVVRKIEDTGGRPFVTVGPGHLPQRMNYAGTREWWIWPEP